MAETCGLRFRVLTFIVNALGMLMLMLTVRDEVERLLADMRAKVLTLQDIRDTIHVSALVRQEALPEVEGSLVAPFARATLMGAWIKHDFNQQAANQSLSKFPQWADIPERAK